jgi:hypothetical protein
MGKKVFDQIKSFEVKEVSPGDVTIMLRRFEMKRFI